MHEGVIGEIYNIGTDIEYSILEVADKLNQHFNKNALEYIPDRDFNDQRYFISTQKLENLGWKQEIFFEEGLNKTIDWYTQHPNHFN